jgi:hypothetical protein
MVLTIDIVIKEGIKETQGLGEEAGQAQLLRLQTPMDPVEEQKQSACLNWQVVHRRNCSTIPLDCRLASRR